MAPSDKDGIVAVVGRLADLAGLDTAYRDLYLRRAAELLQPELDEEGYRALDRQQAASAHLPERIRQAMAAGEWDEVSEMSSRLRSIQEMIESHRSLLDLGRRIYDAEPVAIDPFSPGLQALAGVTARELPGLRDRALKQLSELEGEDAEGQPFYSRRRRALEGLVVGRGEERGSISRRASSARLQEEAAEALEKGNLSRLEEIAHRLAGERGEKPEPEVGGSEEAEGEIAAGAGDLLLDFPEQTREKAASLGLVPMRVESWKDRFQDLRRYLWHPTLADQIEVTGGALQPQSFPFPPDTPEPLKERLALFAHHPFVSSAGGRLLPWVDAEDALVEDFPDPPSGPEAPGGPLLPLLGLKRRHALSRRLIERTLKARAPFVLKELDLDPQEFRLVCIPSDLHLRLGLRQGWGKEQIWTHFDGYMVMGDRHLRPLAGGDVRFGGVHDLVSIGMDYESEGVIVRFAVIQRRRIQAW